MTYVGDAKFKLAWKNLSKVESDKTASNQHELHGKWLSKIFGQPSDRQSFPTNYYYWSQVHPSPIFVRSYSTLYDARANHPTRSELRLYYPDNLVMGETAREGDLLVLVRLAHLDLVASVVQRGTPRWHLLVDLLAEAPGAVGGAMQSAEVAASDVWTARLVELLPDIYQAATASKPSLELISTSRERSPTDLRDWSKAQDQIYDDVWEEDPWDPSKDIDNYLFGFSLKSLDRFRKRHIEQQLLKFDAVNRSKIEPAVASALELTHEWQESMVPNLDYAAFRGLALIMQKLCVEEKLGSMRATEVLSDHFIVSSPDQSRRAIVGTGANQGVATALHDPDGWDWQLNLVPNFDFRPASRVPGVPRPVIVKPSNFSDLPDSMWGYSAGGLVDRIRNY